MERLFFNIFNYKKNNSIVRFFNNKVLEAKESAIN